MLGAPVTLHAETTAPAAAAAAQVAVAPAPAPPPAAPTPTPFDALGDDALDAFGGYNLLYYGAAFAASAVMAFGGADQAIRVGFQKGLVAPAYADGAYYAGYLVPALTAPSLWLVGLAVHDRTTTGAGAAALQALGLTLVTTGALKIAIGRVYPLNGGDPSAPDRLDHPSFAHTFEPFHGLLAWPSGHTSSTISIAAALTAYYPESIAVPLVGYPLALAIGIGMIDGDRHWASDVVGGALIGHAIGYSVGRDFRARVRGAGAAAAAGPHLVPLAIDRGAGVGVAGVF